MVRPADDLPEVPDLELPASSGPPPPRTSHAPGALAPGALAPGAGEFRLQAEQAPLPLPSRSPAQAGGERPLALPEVDLGLEEAQGGAAELEVGSALVGGWGAADQSEATLDGWGADDALGLDLEGGFTSCLVEQDAQAQVARHQPSQRPADEVAWPTGKSPSLEGLQIDAVELEVARGHGRAPTAAWGAPKYAIEVLRAGRRLRPLRAAAHERFLAAEEARDERLVECAQAARTSLEADTRYASALAELRAVEARAGERGEALERAQVELTTFQAGLESQRGALQGQLEAVQGSWAEASEALSAAEVAHRRVEARAKRCAIDRRAVMDAARQRLGPAGGQLPDDLARRLAEVDEQAQALAVELAPLTEALTIARAEHDQRARAARGLEAQLRKLDAEQGGTLGRQRGALELRSEGVGEVERERRVALVGVGQRVLALRGEVPVPAQLLEQLRQADRAVEQAALDVETLARAANAHDAGLVRRGLWMLGAGVVLLVVVFFVGAL